MNSSDRIVLWVLLWLFLYTPENPRDGGTWWAAVYGVAQVGTTETTWQQQYTLQKPSPYHC